MAPCPDPAANGRESVGWVDVAVEVHFPPLFLVQATQMELDSSVARRCPKIIILIIILIIIIVLIIIYDNFR